MTATAATTSRRRSPAGSVTAAVVRAEPTVFWIAVLGQAAVLLTVTHYFPNWDGGAHLATAEIMRTRVPELTRWFTIDWFPLPGLGAHYLMMGGLSVLSPVVTEKLVALGAMVAVPAAGRHLFVGVDRSAGPLTWLLLPIAAGRFVSSGVYGFAYGIAIFLFAIGWWLRRGPDLRRRDAFAFAGILVLAYVAHLLAVLMILFVVLVHLLWVTWSDPERGPSWRRRAAHRGAIVMVAALPALALCAAYVLLRSEGAGFSWLPPIRYAELFVTLRPSIAAYDRLEILPGFLVVATTVLLVLGAMVRHRYDWRWRTPSNAFLVVAALGAAATVVVPDDLATGGFVASRLVLVPFVALLVWRAWFGLSARAAASVMAVGLAITVVLLAVRVPVMRELDADIEEFLSAREVVGEGDTVVQVFFVGDNDPSSPLASARYVRPLHQAVGYLMAEGHVIDLFHYEALFDVFPVHYREEVEPQGRIGGEWITPTPGRVDVVGYEEETAGRAQVDYVLVWGRDAAPVERRRSAVAVELKRQLDARFRRVFVSERGNLEVYEHR